ncbi:deoxyguanosine kinase [Thalassotalea insulae]|uniref:Deoxyguanosine kinase n=1 Tax=Thalassotalea insulae TaxID=2056778 RepID=A0ABQ6GMU5_9GAMM|nr:transporter substrate-binding domain-containing protein [Thalassotalea insulae]GLX77247.1 deoxyguanosine kinase [Thalassotalea insulae]
MLLTRLQSILVSNLVLIGLLISSELFAQTTIDSSRPLSVAVNQTSYPYHFQDSQGLAAGIMVDLWKLWAKKQQVELEFVISPWQQTIDKVKSGTIDIHAGMEQTPKRNEFFSFSAPFFELNNYIRVQRDLVNLTSVEQLLPFTIGVVAGSSHVEQLALLHPKLKLRQYKSRFALYSAALAGEVAAFSNLDKLSENYPRYNDLQLQFPAYKRVLFAQGKYVAAVEKGNQALIEFIEQGFNRISPQEKVAIEKKWLGVAKKNDVLTLVFTPELPPYMAISPSGKPQGLFIDIWRFWAELMGVEIEFVPQSMTDAIEVITQGGADIHIAYPENDLANANLSAAQQIYAVASNVYLPNHMTKLNRLSQLAGQKLGVLKAAPYLQGLKKNYPQIQLMTYRHYQDMIRAAEVGAIDAMLGSVENMQMELSLANLSEQYYSFERSPFISPIYALTQKDNSRLAEIVRDGFNLMPVEKLIEIEKRWLSQPGDGYYQMNANQVTLTNKEYDFIAQHPVINMGINRDWRPVEFVDQNGVVQGINIDVNRLIEQRTGVNFTYTLFDSWNEMLSALQAKKVDVLGSATPTEERKKSLLFSDTYWDMPWVVIHQRQEGKLSSIKDFYGKELAIIRGYHLINKIRQHHPNVNLRLVDNDEEGLLAVKRGVVQGLIENIATASELIGRESLVTLDMSVVDEFNVDQNSFAIRNDWPELKSILDKALLSITSNEQQQIYEKWFAINLATGLDKDTVLKLSAQIGIIILVIIIVIVIWNRRLYQEIKARKSLEAKMKHMATHDELTGLANRVLLKDRMMAAISFHKRQSLMLSVLFIDLDGFKNINDTYGHDVGDELLVEVAKRLKGCVRQSDTIVRFGGDEFVLLLTGLHRREEAGFIADKVLKLVQQPFELSKVEARIGCSIGIAIYPEDGTSESDLLKEADSLMYKVKMSGKNHYVFN